MSFGRRYIHLLAIILAVVLTACTDKVIDDNPTPPFDPPYGEGDGEDSDSKPVLDAIVVFHSYSTYGDGTSALRTYDFKTNTMQSIGSGWSARVKDPMNAMFSLDGKQIVFMGIRVDGTAATGKDSWCLFRYTLGSDRVPELLTATPARDEDPKYSADGKKIVFKRTVDGTGDLWELLLDGGSVVERRLTNAPPGTEYSMPYYSEDSSYVVVSTTTSGNSFGKIERVDIATGKIMTLYQKSRINCYYPIGIDSKRFYYSAGYSANNGHDQIYIGYYNGAADSRLLFNRMDADHSDACPVNDDWVIVSATRTPNIGQYDLWICSTTSDTAFSLNEYNQAVNTRGSELGASVYIRK